MKVCNNLDDMAVQAEKLMKYAFDETNSVTKNMPLDDFKILAHVFLTLFQEGYKQGMANFKAITDAKTLTGIQVEDLKRMCERCRAREAQLAREASP